MESAVVTALAVYAGMLVAVAWRHRRSESIDYLLAGRRLTLGPFVATLVSTWYGGVLGVGEYSYRFGISNWLVFGVPYYLAALLFACIFAARIRSSQLLSIPDQLATVYGGTARRLGAVLVLILAVPAAYVLMLGDLVGIYLGVPLLWAVIAATAFIVIYVAIGGFSAVVDTNIVQFVLMFAAFALLLPVAVAHLGGFGALWAALPASHRSWDGGLGTQAVLVWCVIAMQTLVEPTFYQRCYAASSPQTARRGVLVSIGFWLVFDFLTTFTGLAARVVLPDLARPVLAYPELGRALLHPVANALFAVGLFATVMSTAHSYLFLAATTIDHDLLPERMRSSDRRASVAGLIAVGALSCGLALALRSVVAIWHDVGSIVTSALLLPLALSHAPQRVRYSRRGAAPAMAIAALIATGWILARSGDGSYPLGIEPVFPALASSVAILAADLVLRTTRGFKREPPVLPSK